MLAQSTLFSCDGLFDLTSTQSVIVGGQDPSEFSFDYYLTNADAEDEVNAISNPTVFSGTDGMTIWVRAEHLGNGNVLIVESFLQVDSVVAPIHPDVSACDFYTLPPLPFGQYYSSPGAAGAPITLGEMITTSMTVYIYVQQGQCSDESSFNVFVWNSPVAPIVSDVSSCGPYTLPALPAGYSYHTTSGGNSPFTATSVAETMTLYIFAESGTTPNCTSESSFTVAIYEGTPVDPIEDVVACHSYTLPDLPTGGSYTLNNILLTGPGPYVISQSGVVSLFVPGFCPQHFQVMIHDVTPAALTPVTACDDNNDGFATFDLDLYSSIIPEAIDYEIQYFEAVADAENNMNPLPLFYDNVFPNTQTIYVRISNSPDCYSITPLTLTTVSCGTITGTVLVDGDDNGCTDTDAPLANQQVVLESDNGLFYAYTNAEGVYSFTNIPDGWVFLSVPATSGTMTVSPSSVELEVSGAETLTADFCATPVPQIIDVEVTLTPSQAPRPGFASVYYLKITNAGTVPASGTATYNFDPSMVTFTSTWPLFSSQTSSSVTLDYTGLAPSSHQTFYIYQTVLPPPTVNAGDQLVSSATVTVNGTDINPDNNVVNLNETVVNSYDPNDITCHEGEYISETQADGYLHYTIRFQNTGTADAVNVRLENTLDEDLDWLTFQPITASHTYQIERHEEQLTFRFNNINLPGSQEDEPGSHGYVTYKIRPVSGFEIGDLIENTADIYFDFNAPITTNTFTTQIEQLGINQSELLKVAVYPNPASEKVNIQCADCSAANISIVDVQGKTVLVEAVNFTSDMAWVDVSRIASGMYFLRLEVGDSVVVRKLVVN